MKQIEQIIARQKIEVEKEYEMGGLSDGLYSDYATEVSKRSIKEILEGVIEREKEKQIGQNVIFNKISRDKLQEAHGDNRYNEAKSDTINYIESIIKKL